VRSDNPISGGEIGNELFIATDRVSRSDFCRSFYSFERLLLGVILYSFVCATIAVLYGKLMQILNITTMWYQILHLITAYSFWGATFVKTGSMRLISKEVTSLPLRSIGYSG
jgi:hypothetical protein